MSVVLHVLDHSLPEQSGYAFRSHAILQELAARGLDIVVLTSPKQGPVCHEVEKIEGISYHRTSVAQRALSSGVLGQLSTVWRTRDGISRLVRERAVSFIHAHSPCLNGLAALGLGRPLVYEMRSSWEDAAVSIGTTTDESMRYRLSRALETFVVTRANEIIVICEGLKRELVSRGVPDNKITIVPNALPAEMFHAPDAGQVDSIRSRYGLQGARVIGFFGSFFDWEGLDLLISALPKVLRFVPSARLLLAGSGQQEGRLRTLVDEENLNRYVTFAGRIAHSEVRAFYGVADVMAYPRVRHRLTEMVTPLKPLEAMAQSAPVVASDVGGHQELIEHGKTGFLFRAGERAALAHQLIAVLEGSCEIHDVIRRAQEQVERRHRWAAVGELYLPVYTRVRRLQERRNAPGFQG